MIDDGFRLAVEQVRRLAQVGPDAEKKCGAASAALRIATLGRVRQRPYRAVLLRLVAGEPHGQKVTKAFDWAVAPAPCGPAGCTTHARRRGLRGPEAQGAGQLAKFLDFGDRRQLPEMMAKTENIPAHLGVPKAGVTYNVSPLAKAALNTFVGDVADSQAELRVAGLSPESRGVPANKGSVWVRHRWRNVCR